jgi:hypothetical protein
LDKIEEIRKFFREAKAYNNESNHSATNLKLRRLKACLTKRIIFRSLRLVKEMMMAIDLAKEFGFRLVIVGGSDSWIIADILKENNVAVILSQPHSFRQQMMMMWTSPTKPALHCKKLVYCLPFAKTRKRLLAAA